MKDNQFTPLNHLDCLNQVFPVKGALVVGAGMGEGPWFELLQQIETSVWLVEADAYRAKNLKSRFFKKADWDIEQKIISGKQEENIFYILSNSSENSLLTPDLLRDIWPNIKLKQQDDCQTITIDRLCQENDFAPNWLVLDCLPSLTILEASNVLGNVDVVVVRVVTDNEICAGIQSSHKDIEIFMMDNGFSCIGVELERNPTLGHAVYTRDYAAMFQEKNIEFNVIKDSYEKYKQQTVSKQQELYKKMEELTQRLEKAEQVEFDLRAKQHQLQEQLEQVEEQKTNAEELSVNKSKENKRLMGEIELLNGKLEGIEKSKATIENRNNELIRRQKALNEELIKAEAQLEMLKDLFI